MRRGMWALALVLCAAEARAQWPMESRMMQPDEVLIFSCDASSAYGDVAVTDFTPTVTKLVGTDAKCAPASSILTKLTTTSCNPTFPAATCGLARIAPSTRHGCDYQLHVNMTMANGQVVDCDVRIQVRQAHL